MTDETTKARVRYLHIGGKCSGHYYPPGVKGYRKMEINLSDGQETHIAQVWLSDDAGVQTANGIIENSVRGYLQEMAGQPDDNEKTWSLAAKILARLTRYQLKYLHKAGVKDEDNIVKCTRIGDLAAVAIKAARIIQRGRQ